MSAELLEPDSTTAGKIAVRVTEEGGTAWDYQFPPEEVENVADVLAGVLRMRLVHDGDDGSDEGIVAEPELAGRPVDALVEADNAALRARVEILEQWLESERERVTQLLSQS